MRTVPLALLAVCAAVPLALVPSGASGVAEPLAFRSYAAPAGDAEEAAEPTLGVNPKTGAVIYLAGKQTYRVGDFDAAGPGTSTWTDVSYVLTSLYTADPILETDTTTGRTFVNQLTYSNPGSVMAYTDDDGETWTPVPYGSGVGPNIDHQTVGFGKWTDSTPFVPVGDYPNAIYYCTNDLLYSNCALSLDGGDTFLPSRPAYADTECTPIHGHLKSGPDGTIYLPPDGCNATDGPTRPAGVVVSEDNSFSWEVRRVPGSDSGDAGHPSLAVANDGALYLAYGSRPGGGVNYGPAQVARSADKGLTWTTPVTLGAELGVKSSSFPVAAAGDSDRAAVAFLGTTDEDDPRATGFEGRWDLYVSVTYDAGKTWRTVNVTPESPVQVGSICTNGLGCGGDRNLLDFNDMVIDERGRVVIAIADGCTKSKDCTPDDRGQHGVVVRQSEGRGLLAAFDPRPSAPAPSTPGAPGAPAAPQPRPGSGPSLPSTGGPLGLALGAFICILAAAVSHRRAW